MTSILLSSVKHDSAGESGRKLSFVLGIGEKGAQKILSTAPIKVIQKLDDELASLIIESLREIKGLKWELVSDEHVAPGVNWPKMPSVNGKSMETLKRETLEKTGKEPLAKAAAKKKTAASLCCPHCGKSIELSLGAGGSEAETVVDTVPAEEQGESLDGDIESFSEPEEDHGEEDDHNTDLTDSAFEDWGDNPFSAEESMELGNRIEDSTSFNPDELVNPTDDVTVIEGDDEEDEQAEETPGLEPGVYNVYLPSLKKKSSKEAAYKGCSNILGWSAGKIKAALSKPIVCIGHELNELEAGEMVEQFKDLSLHLKVKKKH